MMCKKPMWQVFLLLLAMLANQASFADEADEPALLVIGASSSNGSTPFNDQLQAPLGGIAVGYGSYLPLGHALIRDASLPGYVINEAQAGASSFDRRSCGATTCSGTIGWQGFAKQLQKALARVTSYDPVTGEPHVNARYVVIAGINDCKHSASFDMPQSQAVPCSPAEVDAFIDRVIDVGRQAMEAGLTPIYEVFPAYSDLNLPLFQQTYHLQWVLSEQDYNALRDRYRSRLVAEFPEAMVLDIWQGYVAMDDGLHPTPATSKRAAQRIATAILQRQHH